MLRSILALGLVATVPGALAAAPSAPTPPLYFNQLGGVKAWRAGGDAVVFVQDRAGQWYKAVLFETCMTLDTSKGVSFLTEINPDTNEKQNKVQVARHVCTVASLTKSDPPPAK